MMPKIQSDDPSDTDNQQHIRKGRNLDEAVVSKHRRVQDFYRHRRIEKDPCFQEADISLSCQQDSGFDPESCLREVENFKTCKTFWHNVKRERIKAGLHPPLPPVEEREQIKKDFMIKTKAAVDKIVEERKKRTALN